MLSPADGKPVPLEAFTPLFPMGLLEQEVSQQREITIPDEVLKVYSLFRPDPAHQGEVPGGGAGNPGHDLLQERKRDAHGQPQAEHGHPAGLLQQEGGREEARHGDRARGSGEARSRSPARISTSTSTSSWSAPPTSRSRTARS